MGSRQDGGRIVECFGLRRARPVGKGERSWKVTTRNNDRLVATALRQRLDRRRLLQTSGAAGLALSSGLRFSGGAAAQEVTFSRDYEATTLNLLMEDLQETTIIEEMLPEFTELTGITVNFEKVGYGVMHEKLVPQLAAGPGNGTYDVLEVDFY